MPNKKHFVVCVKIWVEDDHGNVVFGEGRYRILEAIERLHSLQGAAKELKMSYRALWGRIKASEKRTGEKLVMRDGRGSKLTPLAKQLMDRYQNLQTGIQNESDIGFSKFVDECFDKK